jgi:hypothetical protein
MKALLKLHLRLGTMQHANLLSVATLGRRVTLGMMTFSASECVKRMLARHGTRR